MGSILSAIRGPQQAPRPPGERDAIVPPAPTQAISANVPPRPPPQPNWGQLEEPERSPQSLAPNRYMEHTNTDPDVRHMNTIPAPPRR